MTVLDLPHDTNALFEIMLTCMLGCRMFKASPSAQLNFERFCLGRHPICWWLGGGGCVAHTTCYFHGGLPRMGWLLPHHKMPPKESRPLSIRPV